MVKEREGKEIEKGRKKGSCKESKRGRNGERKLSQGKERQKWEKKKQSGKREAEIGKKYKNSERKTDEAEVGLGKKEEE